jgi:hypothetical protein
VAAPFIDRYESEALALLKPRVERLLRDKIPELFIFQFWLGAAGED